MFWALINKGIKLAQKQLAQIDDNIVKFEQTKDSKYLGEAIIEYEIAASGFNLNNVDIKDKHTNEHNIVRSLFEKNNLKKICLQYIVELNESGTSSEITRFREFLEDIQIRYDITNQRKNVVKSIVSTKSMLNIQDLINMLNDVYE